MPKLTMNLDEFTARQYRRRPIEPGPNNWRLFSQNERAVCESVRALRFVPIFSSVRWILSNGLQCRGSFTMQHPGFATPSRSLPFHHTFPDLWLLKKSRCQPFWERSVYRAAAAVLPWQCLPLTARSQHIEYPLQRFPRQHWLASLAQSMDIVFFWIPLFTILLFIGDRLYVLGLPKGLPHPER